MHGTHKEKGLVVTGPFFMYYNDDIDHPSWDLNPNLMINNCYL